MKVEAPHHFEADTLQDDDVNLPFLGPRDEKPAAGDDPPVRWRQWLASARVRIVAWHLLLLALALALSFFAVRTILLVRLDERIERELQQEVEELRTLATGDDPETGEPFRDNVDRILQVFLRRNLPARYETFVTYLDGQPYLRSSNEPPLRLDHDDALTGRWATLTVPELSTVQRPEVGSITYHAVPLVIDGEARAVFVSAWFRDLEAAEINEVVQVAGGLGILVLLFASAIVWNVTGRVLQPVREVAATARAITDTDLSRRINAAGADEVGQLAATFNAMLDRLEGAFAAQRQFVDDAGHELRTPITIIRGHLELLEYGDAAEREQTVALVLDELDRMHRLVNDLLLLAKFQRPDFLRVESVDLAPFMQETFDKAIALGDRRWKLEAVADAAVLADRQRLTQAVVQLAQNAVQHTETGDAVTLGSAIEQGTLRLWVRDTGPGIAEADRERIFERFARAEASARGHEGAGLGLAIVEAIARAHDGSVAVESAPGQGATFTIRLPTRSVEPRPEPTPTPEPVQ